jgi:hypothetical protein
LAVAESDPDPDQGFFYEKRIMFTFTYAFSNPYIEYQREYIQAPGEGSSPTD